MSVPAQERDMPAAPMADPGARPMTPGVRAGLVAIASVIFWLGPVAVRLPVGDRDAVRLDDPAAR